MGYERVTEPERIAAYLDGRRLVAFDFETAPTGAWRGEETAALDVHKAGIVGGESGDCEDCA